MLWILNYAKKKLKNIHLFPKVSESYTLSYKDFSKNVVLWVKVFAF
jgi:hypothetical protein